jgi:hypothetical protein
MIAMQIFRRIFTPEPRVRCQLHEMRAILDIHWLLDLEAEEEELATLRANNVKKKWSKANRSQSC